IKRIIKLSYYKKKYDLDIVMSFLYSANVVNYYSIGKAKTILSCRGYSDYKKNNKKYRKMLDRIDFLIVQTDRMKEEFVKELNADESKVKVLHNPFNIKLIKEKKNEDIEINIKQFIET